PERLRGDPLGRAPGQPGDRHVPPSRAGRSAREDGEVSSVVPRTTPPAAPVAPSEYHFGFAVAGAAGTAGALPAGGANASLRCLASLAIVGTSAGFLGFTVISEPPGASFTSMVVSFITTGQRPRPPPPWPSPVCFTSAGSCFAASTRCLARSRISFV